MGPREDTFMLPPQPTAPGYARAVVREAISGTFSPSSVDAIALCVSELVTNALDHAEPPFRLFVAQDENGLRVAVEDGSDGRPVIRPAEPGAERGRGMFLVDELASAWGVEGRPGGKVVWARFDR